MMKTQKDNEAKKEIKASKSGLILLLSYIAASVILFVVLINSALDPALALVIYFIILVVIRITLSHLLKKD